MHLYLTFALLSGIAIPEIGVLFTSKNGAGSLESHFHMLLPSIFGTFGIVWKNTEDRPKVQRVFLPNAKSRLINRIHADFAGSKAASCESVLELSEQIQRFLKGEPVKFELEIVALETCSSFQRKVLLAEYGIPRGWISTYGRISKSLGIAKGARAVGRVLSRNPFPIIIPCHRAIRSNGELG